MNEDTPPDLDVETARLGIEAEAFLRSNLGRFLIDRANLDIEKGKDELVDILPEDVEGNRRVRNKIQVARQIKDYLAEVIHSGMVATNDINETEALESQAS